MIPIKDNKKKKKITIIGLYTIKPNMKSEYSQV